METITMGEIASGIVLILTISGFFMTIFKWYKKSITNRLDNFEHRITALENESITKKKENSLMLHGLLACLKGLRDKGCNGPVTESIHEIEEYLIEK